MVKAARAINDNIASMVYNHYNDLETFFWIGLIVSGFSFVCVLALTELHNYYIDSNARKN